MLNCGCFVFDFIPFCLVVSHLLWTPLYVSNLLSTMSCAMFVLTVSHAVVWCMPCVLPACPARVMRALRVCHVVGDVVGVGIPLESIQSTTHAGVITTQEVGHATTPRTQEVTTQRSAPRRKARTQARTTHGEGPRSLVKTERPAHQTQEHQHGMLSHHSSPSSLCSFVSYWLLLCD